MAAQSPAFIDALKAASKKGDTTSMPQPAAASAYWYVSYTTMEDGSLQEQYAKILSWPSTVVHVAQQSAMHRMTYRLTRIGIILPLDSPSLIELHSLFDWPLAKQRTGGWIERSHEGA
jgi:hypothetical protein